MGGNPRISAANGINRRHSGFSATGWQEFHRLGGEFVERLTGHIQKEEIGLAAAVDAMLDDETDNTLAMAYLADR